jgi:superfamily II DNA or RNA helicase
VQEHLRLRRWQAEAMIAWENAGMRGTVKVVTGGGKTIFALACAGHFLERSPAGRVVVIVPTVALMDQWAIEIAAVVGLPPEQIACFGGGEHTDQPGVYNIVVLNTARTLVPTLAQSSRCFVIVDECHRIATAQNARALDGEFAATLGLSATPERDYDSGFEDVVVPQVGAVVYEYGYSQAFAEGVITPFNLVNVAVKLGPAIDEQIQRLSRVIAKGGGLEAEEAVTVLLRKRAALSATAPIRIPWSVKLALAHREERVIIFHERIEAMEAIARALQARGVSVLTYHSAISGPLRRSNLLMFRQGVCRMLATCRALDEGANVPEANVAIVASSTASSRQRIQRLGRVLRPAPGKERATVYTLYGTTQEEARLRDEATSMGDIALVEWRVGGSR